MKFLTLVLCGLLGFTGLMSNLPTVAEAAQVVKASDAKELILGKWHMDTSKYDITFEFLRDGTLNVVIMVKDKPVKLVGTYVFADDTTLKISVKNPANDKEVHKTFKIKSITQEKMVLEAADEEVSFTRVK